MWIECVLPSDPAQPVRVVTLDLTRNPIADGTVDCREEFIQAAPRHERELHSDASDERQRTRPTTFKGLDHGTRALYD